MEVKQICTLSDKEKEAIETFQEFDCSDLDACSDCPFNTDSFAIDRITGSGTYNREIYSSCIIKLVQSLLFKIND